MTTDGRFNIAFLQEIKWRCSNSKEIGDVHKYAGKMIIEMDQE